MTKYGQFDSIRVKNALLVNGPTVLEGDFDVTGDVTITGAWTVTGALTVGGALSIDDTTEASSTVTGSLHTDGGAGIAKKLYVGGNIYGGVSGAGVDVTFYGDTVGSDFVWDQNGDTNGSLTLGATTKPVDFRVYGTVAATYLHWDSSVDDLLLVGTASRISSAGTDETTSGATGAIHTAGGIGAAKKVFVGTDLLINASGDIVVAANAATALEFYDSTTKFILLDTRNTVTGVSNVVFTGIPATIASAATIAKNTVSIVPGTTTTTGTTGSTTPLDGIALTIAAPTIAGEGGHTVTQASTVYIAAAPIASVLTITTGYALEIASGNFLTAGRIITSEATAASSLATGSIQVAGGIAVTGTSWFGGDLNLATGAMDVVIIANTAAALEISDATTKLLAIDTRNTITGVTNVAITGAPATIASASGVTRITSSIATGVTTFSGTTGVDALDGMGLNIAAPVFAGTAVAVTQASTLYIAGAPTAGGSVTVTNAYSIHVDDGMTALDGGITVPESVENIMLPTVLKTNVTYAGTSGACGTIGAGETWLVHAVLVDVTTDFDTAGNDDATLIIGTAADTDGFATLADAQLQAAATGGTGWAAGWQCQVAATIGDFLDGYSGGFVLEGAETIDYAIGGTAADAGVADIYVIYTRIA